MIDIQGYEGRYAIEEDGTVWGYPSRANGMKMRKKAIYVDKTGYASTTLCKNGRAEKRQIHRLIALHFIDGNTEQKNCTNHKDGNKLNNSLDNLEWVTIAENNAHALANGLVRTNTEALRISRRKNGLLTCRQNARVNRKITFLEAECIRQIKQICKVSYRKLGRLYKLSDKTIANICTFKTYQEA